MNDIVTNGTEIKQRIISELNNSTQNVYLAMAFFTDRDIATSIIGAKYRGVIVDIILSSNTQNETVKQMFNEANIKIHAFETGDERGMMHHKFCLIDNKITINGSYNYSYNASNNNVENIHISDDYSIYKQFLVEFERLKFNIDNNIDVNSTQKINKQEIQQVQPTNIIDTFTKQLNDLVFSSSQINAEEYKRKGKETSKDSKGHLSIFTTEYGNIKQEIKALAASDGLNNRKNILSANISNAFESTTANLNSEMQQKIASSTRDNDLEKQQIKTKTLDIQQEKIILERGNESTNEKGLLQINTEIEKKIVERRALDQSLITKEFWSAGGILLTFLSVLFTCYLSIFFASALYKMLFESDVIRKSLEAGINPGLPKLIDANAIIKIYRQEGILFGFIGLILFLFPILLSNLKLIGSKNKKLNNVMFGVGLVIFDLIVAGMIAINTDEIKCLLIGKESQLALWEVVKQGEFWMIFMFGTVPLIISHYLIENIKNAYNNSKREIVDAEKNRQIQILDLEMINLISEKELKTMRIKEKDELISENKNKILLLETEINEITKQIESKYLNIQTQISSIYEGLKAKIISGKIFTEEILDSVISAYKSGFIEFLPEYYASEEVANRLREIEQIISVK